MCPVCREPMVAFELEGVEIDHCVACRGTWLDAGELEMITELAGAASGELGRVLAGARHARRTRLRCPRCPRRLREITLGDGASIVLDRCPRGHGLWLDQGEMAAVIRSFASGEEGAVARFFAELYRSELESIGKGE